MTISSCPFRWKLNWMQLCCTYFHAIFQNIDRSNISKHRRNRAGCLIIFSNTHFEYYSVISKKFIFVDITKKFSSKQSNVFFFFNINIVAIVEGWLQRICWLTEPSHGVKQVGDGSIYPYRISKITKRKEIFALLVDKERSTLARLISQSWWGGYDRLYE